MTSRALFVDLPNFCSRLLLCGIREPRALRDYFLYWLDFDRLAYELTGDFSDVWVFYSGRRFGPKPNRIKDEYLDNYIDRINSLTGVTALDVNIPGLQREPASYECDECGHTGVAQWESEKGIDASLIVRLFDTMDTWDVAYLLSGDADYVPAVASLRRRGKIVVGAGFAGVSSALVRECYNYIDLVDVFLKEDVFAYLLFKTSGIAQRWLNSEVRRAPKVHPQEEVKLELDWEPTKLTQLVVGDSSISHKFTVSYHVRLDADPRGVIDLSDRLRMVKELQAGFPDWVKAANEKEEIWEFHVSLSAWKGVERRLKEFISSMRAIEPVGRRPGRFLRKVYRYNAETELYEALFDNGSAESSQPA